MREFDRQRLAARQAHAHALCAYAEPLVRGRRVLVVADPALDLGSRMTGFGARTVHLYDPSPVPGPSSADMAPTIANGTVIRPLPSFDRGGDFDVRDGAYDFALVPDLGAVADHAALLARLRRVLGNEGALLAGARNPDRTWKSAERRGPREGYGGPERRARSIPYAELYDVASLQFASIRMLAQMPFRGLVIAELGLGEDDAPEVSVDTQLADEAREGAAEPHLFYVLASQRDVRLDAYTVLQLPDGPERAEGTSGDSADVAAIAAAQLRADVLRSQLEEEKANSARLVEARNSAGTLDATKYAELELALAARTQAAVQAEARAAEHFARTERISGEVSRLDDELRRERDRVQELTAVLVAERREREAEEVVAETQRDRGVLAEAIARVRALETALGESQVVAAAFQARAVAGDEALSSMREELDTTLAELERARVKSSRAPAVDTAVLDALSERATQAESIIAQLEGDLASIGELHSEELTQLETSLRERGQALQAMEREVTRRDRLVQELVAALEDARATVSHAATPASSGASVASATSLDSVPGTSRSSNEDGPRLRAQIEHLSLEIARREGELEARAWRIAELEREVTLTAQAASANGHSNGSRGAAPPAAASKPKLAEDADVNALRAELDALRQALAQEHSAKVRAESGSSLEEARAELARQSVLIEQLSRELASRAGVS